MRAQLASMSRPRGSSSSPEDGNTFLQTSKPNSAWMLRISQESSTRLCVAEAPAFSRQQPETMPGSPALVPWLEDWAGPLRGWEHLEEPRGGLGFPLRCWSCELAGGTRVGPGDLPGWARQVHGVAISAPSRREAAGTLVVA